jgi:hypothetical protein
MSGLTDTGNIAQLSANDRHPLARAKELDRDVADRIELNFVIHERDMEEPVNWPEFLPKVPTSRGVSPGW